MPGVYLEAAGAHTEGSMNVHVAHRATASRRSAATSSTTSTTRSSSPSTRSATGAAHHRQPRRLQAAGEGAIKKLLTNARYLLPVHDRPAKIEHGMVVGRLHDVGAGAGRAVAAEAQLVPGVTEPTDDPHRAALRIRGTDRRLCAGRPARHRLHLHRRADLASGRSLSAVLRHAGRRAPALGCARRRARGAAAVEQAQRHDL